MRLHALPHQASIAGLQGNRGALHWHVQEMACVRALCLPARRRVLDCTAGALRCCNWACVALGLVQRCDCTPGWMDGRQGHRSVATLWHVQGWERLQHKAGLSGEESCTAGA